jgi:hypothetical protein
VAPGVYIGTATVTLKPFVHVQGAGQEATVISSLVDDTTISLAGDASLRDLTVVNAAATASNIALLAQNATGPILVESVTARSAGSGPDNYAVRIIGSAVTLRQVTALAENGFSDNFALHIALGTNPCVVTITHSALTARYGSIAYGIHSQDAILTAASTTVLAEEADTTYGLVNTSGATAILSGGSYTARAISIGFHAYGMKNDLSATLIADGVTALGENAGTTNQGLYNTGVVTLTGGLFSGSGGVNAYGLKSENGLGVLRAHNLTAVGTHGSTGSYGLFNANAQVTLVGGAYSASSATGSTYGAYNTNGLLAASSVTMRGDDYGLYNYGDAAEVTGGLLAGATSVENGGTGSVTVSNSRLEGGAADASVVCLLVSRGADAMVTGPCP